MVWRATKAHTVPTSDGKRYPIKRGQMVSAELVDLSRPHLYERVDQPTAPRAEPEPEVEAERPTPKVPSKYAAKPVWVAWAIAAHGMTPSEAEAMTVKQLQALAAEDEGDG